MKAGNWVRFMIYSATSLAIDGSIVLAFLWWGDNLRLDGFLLGLIVIWGIRLAVGLRNTITAIAYYFLGHETIRDQLVQHMRLKGYPRDVPAYDWFSYFQGASLNEDLPREVLSDMAATNGNIAGAKQVSILSGALLEHLIDRAVVRYLA